MCILECIRDYNNPQYYKYIGLHPGNVPILANELCRDDLLLGIFRITLINFQYKILSGIHSIKYNMPLTLELKCINNYLLIHDFQINQILKVISIGLNK
jgi:hypothetical protein